MDRIRTCIGCAAKKDKRLMFRIAKTADGSVRFDEKDKMQGRGAYVCSSECLEKVRQNSKLSNALRCKIDDETYSVIAESLLKSQALSMVSGEE